MAALMDAGVELDKPKSVRHVGLALGGSSRLKFTRTFAAADTHE